MNDNSFFAYILATGRSVLIYSLFKDAFSAQTIILTPLSRVLPEKLTGPQLAKKFPNFYGTRRFITALT
jgi:hypothetical protein